MAKKRTRLTVEGWYYLMVLAFVIGGAVMREINLLLFVAGILIGPLLISWRLVGRSLQGITMRRRLPSGIGAREMLVAEIAISNTSRKRTAWGVTVEDQIRLVCDAPAWCANWVAGEHVRVLFPRIEVGVTQIANYHGRIGRRGRYRIGPLSVSTRFPFGLIRRTLTVADEQILYVYPKMGRMLAAWTMLAQPDRVGNQRSRQRRGSSDGEFHSLRDHRSSDSQRWIHWRTTARRNKLTVKQFEREQSQDLEILLDLFVPPGQDEARRIQHRQEVERMISFAATVCADHCRRGSSRLLLGIAGQQIALVGGVTSMNTLEDCLEKLAVATPSDRDRLPELLDEVLSERQFDSRVVVISPQRVDLSDTDRFEAIWHKSRERSMLGRIVCLTVDSPKFRSCFEMTDEPDPTPGHFHAGSPR